MGYALHVASAVRLMRATYATARAMRMQSVRKQPRMNNAAFRARTEERIRHDRSQIRNRIRSRIHNRSRPVPA
ncbi:hypothetical protein, partial [Bifidobacterium avesanii]|uniref:hypothetical protein n=1 Tax=Bifidobacterium avesanii TaxID=1798157 RepID=UPI00197AAF22